MKKLIFAACLLSSVSAYADRLGGIKSGTSVLLSTQSTQIYPATGTPSFVNGASLGPATGPVLIPGVYNAIGDPTGFLNRTSTLTFIDSTRTLTIVGDHVIYINGVATTKAGGATKQIADTAGIHWIYYDKSGVLQEGAAPGMDYPLVASVYWNATSTQGLVGDERHGIKMDQDTHKFIHDTIGTRWQSGCTGTFDNFGSTITTCSIDDEDIEFVIPTTNTFTNLYKNGSADFSYNASTSVYYVRVGTSSVLRWNNGNNLADVANTNYVAYWIFATNGVRYPIASIMGQRQDTTIANARTNNTYESLTFGTFPFQEAKLLYRVIMRNVAGVPTYVETQDYRSVSSVPSGTYVASSHNLLTNLNWTNAGHTFDTNLNVGAYDVLATSVTAPGANISTVTAITKLEFLDGTTQTSAPSAGVNVYPATSTILGVAGTSAAVSYGFTGDPNTGIMALAADSLQTVAGGVITSSHTSAGEIVQPLQPSFFAEWSENPAQNDKTGDYTWFTHVFDTEIWDSGGDYNNSTYIFTAPVTGKYLFTANVVLGGMEATMINRYMRFTASNRSIIVHRINTTAQHGITGGVYLDMDANDTIKVDVSVGPGSKTADLNGGSGYSQFSGSLIN